MLVFGFLNFLFLIIADKFIYWFNEGQVVINKNDVFFLRFLKYIRHIV
jgi:hypothetical protein